MLAVLDLIVGALAVVVVFGTLLLVDAGATVVFPDWWPLVLADFLLLAVEFWRLAVELP